MSDGQKAVWDRLWSREVSYQWDSLSQSIFETICESVGEVKGKRVLEAGSGTGKVSLHLAMEGAHVTLVDYSEKALENSRTAFRQANCEGSFVLSDIRRMHALNNQYDLTWNAGVLEHFTFDEKVTILKEMARVTKPGGTIVIMTPYSKCLPYRIGKAFAERQGTWMYGVEQPVLTLKDEFAHSGITFLDERDIGFVNSLDFLDFIPSSHVIKNLILEWYEGLPDADKSLFPGYLLVSKGIAAG
ncbi:class I SAM-dependent methyltransferase [Paenibacillus sp. S28]|uniref:class I SAM-dependent methyltransferase n=1 Tax=Paenibacillus sp. S28 TaxID=2767463 RepID=UPI00190C294D|nr:class I SAM-dependent methyltransferase [Paenibacillus sp. S28]MBJ9993537.1 class I SAM-dependent methyltransferase [Paenibacillus sp. S28]